MPRVRSADSPTARSHGVGTHVRMSGVRRSRSAERVGRFRPLFAKTGRVKRERRISPECAVAPQQLSVAPPAHRLPKEPHPARRTFLRDAFRVVTELL